MAETQLKDLLNDFDKAFPEGITEEELLAKSHSLELINRAVSSLLIRHVNGRYHFNKEGLEMLMMVRTKESIDKLDVSINKFEVSSSKQANKMVNLTIWIKGLTIALFLLALFQLIILIKQIS